jgi:RNA polymerase sigma factor (sigma-70 family)
MSDEEHWQRLITGLRDGDNLIIHEFFDQYGHMLHKLADQKLAPGVRRRIGPEDVVQSACRTFLRRAELGEFTLDNHDALWRLLCAITLTKMREQTRFHLRQKRGLQKEIGLAAPAEASMADFQPVAPGPTPSEEAEFADQFTKALAGLNNEERQIVEWRLQELTQDEIAEKLGCSERTVRRVLKKVEAHLLSVLEASRS